MFVGEFRILVLALVLLAEKQSAQVKYIFLMDKWMLKVLEVRDC